MEQFPMAKQMMEMSKKVFDDGFRSVSALQDEAEKIARNFLDKAPFFPQEGKKLFSDWTDSYKKCREYFKSTADGNYAKVSQYFAPPETKAAKTKKSKNSPTT